MPIALSPAGTTAASRGRVFAHWSAGAGQGCGSTRNSRGLSALGYWFGIGCTAVWRWRAAFGVGSHKATPGTRQAVQGASRKGADAMKSKDWTEEECDRKTEAAKRCGTRPPPRWTPEKGGWTAGEIELLGTDSDGAIARKLRRTVNAAAIKRGSLGIPKYRVPDRK